MQWSVLPFSKHKGKTLPGILVRDIDWFFWMLPNLYGRIGEEAEDLAHKARAIKIPSSFGKNVEVEYRFEMGDRDLAGYASYGGKRSGSGMVARGIGGANVEIGQRVMGKVKVYRFRTYDAAKDDWFISTRMATREEIESSKTLELVPGTEAEIDSKHLLLGRWTDRNFDPRKSN
jgi:hypothetical protein